MAYAVGIALSLVVIVSIMATAHYLQQIQDVLRFAARLGVSPK